MHEIPNDHDEFIPQNEKRGEYTLEELALFLNHQLVRPGQRLALLGMGAGGKQAFPMMDPGSDTPLGDGHDPESFYYRNLIRRHVIGSPSVGIPIRFVLKPNKPGFDPQKGTPKVLSCDKTKLGAYFGGWSKLGKNMTSSFSLDCDVEDRARSTEMLAVARAKFPTMFFVANPSGKWHAYQNLSAPMSSLACKQVVTSMFPQEWVKLGGGLEVFPKTAEDIEDVFGVGGQVRLPFNDNGYMPVDGLRPMEPIKLTEPVIPILAEPPAVGKDEAAPVLGPVTPEVIAFAKATWRRADDSGQGARSADGQGNRDRKDIGHFYHDCGLPLDVSLDILRAEGIFPDPDQVQWDRALKTGRSGRYARGWRRREWEAAGAQPYQLAPGKLNPYAVDDVFGPGSETPPARPDVWHGVLHFGDKLFIGGRSKAGKTWALMGFGLSVSAGVPYWGIPTTKTNVLYVNLELNDVDFKRRAALVRQKLVFRQEDVSGFKAIHLRGFVEDLDTMYPRLLATAGRDYGMIILDPLYKVFGNRNENDAGQMTSLCNLLEKIASETGAAVVSAMHFAKGNASSKDSMDRISGSGVIARDPDALVMLTPHEKDNNYVVEFTLRDFATPKPFVVSWNYPLLQVDATLDATKLKDPKSKGFVAAQDVEKVMDHGEELTKFEIVVRMMAQLQCAKNKAEFAVGDAIVKGYIVGVGSKATPGRYAELFRLSTKGLPTPLPPDPSSCQEEVSEKPPLLPPDPIVNSRKKATAKGQATNSPCLSPFARQSKEAGQDEAREEGDVGQGDF